MGKLLLRKKLLDLQYIESMSEKKPIIFSEGPEDDFVEGEQTMDLLLHYAQSGILEAEYLMRTDPGLFSEEDVMDFAANKVVLAKVPDVLEDYKLKVREFETLQGKVQSVLAQCDNIISHYEIRKQEEQPHQEAGTIRYSPDGDMIVTPAKPINKLYRKVNITLPKPDRE